MTNLKELVGIEVLDTSSPSHTEVMTIAKDIFGSERVVSDSAGEMHCIIIHFPEIVIRNSSNNTHTIRDLFFKILYSSNSLVLEGIRTTMTVSEFQSGYSHSHLSSCSIGQWGSWCLGGGGSDFRMLYEALHHSPNKTKNLWEMFLLSIANYVSWESIEGGPHFSIQRIGRESRGISRLSSDQINSELKRLFKDMPRDDIWEFSEGIRLIENSPILHQYFDENSQLRKLEISDDEEYVKRVLDNLKGKTFKFGTRKIPLQVINDRKVKPEDDTSIDIGLFRTYISKINEQLYTFNKTHMYESLKRSKGSLATRRAH